MSAQTVKYHHTFYWTDAAYSQFRRHGNNSGESHRHRCWSRVWWSVCVSGSNLTKALAFKKVTNKTCYCLKSTSELLAQLELWRESKEHACYRHTELMLQQTCCTVVLSQLLYKQSQTCGASASLKLLLELNMTAPHQRLLIRLLMTLQVFGFKNTCNSLICPSFGCTDGRRPPENSTSAAMDVLQIPEKQTNYCRLFPK